jgi:transposase
MTHGSNNMGYFSNLSVDIEEALYQGATVEQIAERFDVSVSEVIAVIEMIEESDSEPYAWD